MKYQVNEIEEVNGMYILKIGDITLNYKKSLYCFYLHNNNTKLYCIRRVDDEDLKLLCRRDIYYKLDKETHIFFFVKEYIDIKKDKIFICIKDI